MREPTEGCTLYAFWYERPSGSRDWAIHSDRELVERWRNHKCRSYKIGQIIEYNPTIRKRGEHGE